VKYRDLPAGALFFHPGSSTPIRKQDDGTSREVGAHFNIATAPDERVVPLDIHPDCLTIGRHTVNLPQYPVIDLLRFALSAVLTGLEASADDPDRAMADAQAIANDALELTSQYEPPGKDSTLDNVGLKSWHVFIQKRGLVAPSNSNPLTPAEEAERNRLKGADSHDA
jgi:hypothetical protein